MESTTSVLSSSSSYRTRRVAVGALAGEERASYAVPAVSRRFPPAKAPLFAALARAVRAAAAGGFGVVGPQLGCSGLAAALAGRAGAVLAGAAIVYLRFVG